MEITLINLTESEAGVRRVPRNYRSVTGRVETFVGDTVEYESLLERDFIYLLDFNARVKKIVSQPIQIQYRVGGGPVRRYTPDFLVRFRPLGEAKVWRPMLYEVKSQDELVHRSDELKEPFAAARKVCRARGWSFRVITEDFIRTPYLENVKFLRSYRSYPDDGAKSLMLLKMMEEMRVATPWQLLAATFMDMTNRMEAVGVLWRLICNRAIGANLMSKLTNTSEIWHQEPAVYGTDS